MNERRHPRFSVALSAELELPGGVVAAETQNVSEGGVGLVLEQAVTEGQELRITLLLTQDGIEDPHEEPLAARAVVAWCTERTSTVFQAGVRFTSLSAADKTRLARFVAALGD